MKICILIPAYNEARTIGQIVKSVRQLNFDVIVVDDGSSDQTAQFAKESGADLVVNYKNRGKGYSLKKGFIRVLKRGYDGVLIMDGDAQHSTDDIPQFIKLAQEANVEVINGNRMADASKMPLVRLLTNRVMSWMISLACRQKIPDSQCGFRYLSAKALRDIRIKRSAYEVETEILMQASRKGYRVFSVPIQTIYGDEKSKINPFVDTIRFVTYFFREIFKK